MKINKKNKLTLIEKFLSLIVIIIGGFFTYNVAVNGLYNMGANLIFKEFPKCQIYKDLYIVEMKKGKDGKTSPIIDQAKNNLCKK